MTAIRGVIPLLPRSSRLLWITFRLTPSSRPISASPPHGTWGPRTKGKAREIDVDAQHRILVLQESAPGIRATDLGTKESRRMNIDGQCDFIGGSWSLKSNAQHQASPALNVKVFNSTNTPDKPTWADVGPIVYQFYAAHAYMVRVVDLSSYADVHAKVRSIKGVFILPFDHPGYMPVTRELSRDQRGLIVKWIDQGCPAT